MNRIKTWAGARIKPLFLGVTTTLLVVGIASLVLSMGGSDPEADAEQIAATKAELAEDRDAAQADLTTAHEELLADLPGVDSERVERDRVNVRDFVLTLSATSATSRTTEQEQISLDAQYEVLDEKSRVLTEFLPEWIASTTGTSYTLSEVDTQVSGIQGLDYSYSVLARLDPIDDQGRSQFIFLTLTTSQDGTITEVEAYRVTNSSRNDLMEGDQASEPDSADETTEPSDDGGDSEG